jgi:hypothetical protein
MLAMALIGIGLLATAAPAQRTPVPRSGPLTPIVVTPHPGEVCVTKYEDANGNGARNAGEAALAGWQFTIRNSANVQVAQGVTDATGRYCRILPVGNYSVAETLQPGWTQTDPAAGARSVSIPTAQTVNIVFGNRRPPSVSRPDLRIDTAFNRAIAPRPPGGVLALVVTTTQAAGLPVGTQITIQGSMTPPGPFSPMTVLTAGWTCSGTWASFQCSKVIASPTIELVELHTTYPANLVGSPFTYTATLSMVGTNDANPADNIRTVNATLP